MHHTYTIEEKKNMETWIRLSIRLLIENDSNLLSPDPINSIIGLEGQKPLNRELHEMAINHRLAFYLEKLFEQFGIEGYYCDIEYNRFINNRKMVRSIRTGEQIEVRPDIIIHKRERLQEPCPHLLVVEAKKRSTIEKDRNHIYDIMWDSNYCYKYGLLISYYENKKTINYEVITLENKEFNLT